MKITLYLVACLAVVGTGCNPPADRPAATEPAINKTDLIFADRLEFSGVSYKSVNPYKELAGRHENFRLRGTGFSNDLAKNSEALNDGRHNTLIAMRKAGNTRIR